MTKIWIYDIEVYPNLFCVTFWDNQAKEKKVFEISERINEGELLYNFLQDTPKLYLVGFNSISYDDQILRRFIYDFERTQIANIITKDLFDLSKYIVSQEDHSKITKAFGHWKSIDLMLIHRFHKLGIGLKQVGVTLKCPKIQDLPYAYDKILTSDEIDNVIAYNANDVFITWKLYKASIEELNLRQKISDSYDVNVLNSSRTNIADKIVTKYIRDKTGWSWDYLNSLRDTDTSVELNAIISPSIEFKHPTLVRILETLRSSVIDANNADFEYSFVFDDSKYTLALGGLHSDNKSQIYNEDENYVILDADMGAFYPSLMINLNIYPPQLGEVYLETLVQLTNERLEAKANKESVKDKTLKIVINGGFYGKLGFPYGYSYSPRAMYKTTINGQLMLLQWIEELYDAGIHCFYANTDGITCKVHKDKVDLYYEICNNYSKKINISVEFQQYKKCIIKDCNNYLIVTSEGKLKKKGSFLTDTFDANWEIPHKNATEILSKGFDAPVVAKAVEAYFIDNIPIKEFITNHKDLYDFCKSQKVGREFEVFSTSSLNGEVKYKLEQKTNRYIITNRGQKLFKKKKGASDTEEIYNWSYDENHGPKTISNYTDLTAGFYITLFNNYTEEVDINYSYYVNECNKIIYLFENNQLSLF